MTKLIAFTGFKQSGKDTCAKYLINNHNFIQYSFALPLKEGVKAFFGWDDTQVNDPVKKEEIDPFYGVSPRYILQIFGTEIMRNYVPSLSPEFKDKMGNNFWVNRFKQFYAKNPDKYIVVSDLRYQNELDAVKSLGGVVVRVKRDSVIPSGPVHASENIDSLQGIVYLLDNNVDIFTLEEGLQTILSDLKS